MKIFVWEGTRPVSNNYHDGGGLLIIAANLDRARELWSEYVDNLSEWEKFEGKGATDKEPDRVYFTEPDTEETVLVFPDSGCC